MAAAIWASARAALHRQHRVPRGEIFHARRHDLRAADAQSGTVRALQREQIQQHLHADAVQDLRQIELLFSRFIVHHAQIEFAVLQPAVHPVHPTADPQSGAVGLDRHGGQRSLAAESQFKSHGHKVGHRQFRRHIVHNGIGLLAQAVEQIAEAGALVRQAAQAFFGKALHILPRPDGAVPPAADSGKPPRCAASRAMFSSR